MHPIESSEGLYRSWITHDGNELFLIRHRSVDKNELMKGTVQVLNSDRWTVVELDELGENLIERYRRG